jgi:2-succinyl-6-hydroxy-2,4-cyclohexadiene-1-carboxylate synthase
MPKRSKPAEPEPAEPEPAEPKATLYCLHGAFGHAEQWGWLRKHLEPGLRLHAVDLWQTPQLPLEAWGRWFSQSVASAPGPRFLLGYSMGGRLAMHALLAAPEAWCAAALVSAHTGLGTAREREARRQADARWLERWLTDSPTAFWQAWCSQPVFENGEAQPVPHWHPQMDRAFGPWSLAQQSPLLGQLGGLQCPLLWVAGAGDPKFARLSAQASRQTPGSALTVIQQAGHRVPWEAPKAFASRLGDFLKTRPGGRDGNRS